MTPEEELCPPFCMLFESLHLPVCVPLLICMHQKLWKKKPYIFYLTKQRASGFLYFLTICLKNTWY